MVEPVDMADAGRCTGDVTWLGNAWWWCDRGLGSDGSGVRAEWEGDEAAVDTGCGCDCDCGVVCNGDVVRDGCGTRIGCSVEW